MTEENDAAADPNSEASASQAAAAPNIGAAPAPANIRAELISGANTEKFITTAHSVTVRGDVPTASTSTTRHVSFLHEIGTRIVQCAQALPSVRVAKP